MVLDSIHENTHGPRLYYFFNTLLIMLLVMHLYWFALILRVIWKQVQSGGVDDVRSGEATTSCPRVYDQSWPV